MSTLLAKIDKDALINAANLTWQGMLAIFIVMTLIFVAVIILNKVTAITKADIKDKFKRLKQKFSKSANSNTDPVQSKIDTDGDI
ncbi:MAG: hypothetical protein LBF68_03160 [Christensenellaceae bacterium]|jgi:Na+-transporting methylmalonyl-CoA/oxaloacetate decarboxylase gamma subunit|nr:hypothetical protein [Christensenellaceae bacterium]